MRNRLVNRMRMQLNGIRGIFQCRWKPTAWWLHDDYRGRLRSTSDHKWKSLMGDLSEKQNYELLVREEVLGKKVIIIWWRLTIWTSFHLLTIQVCVKWKYKVYSQRRHIVVLSNHTPNQPSQAYLPFIHFSILFVSPIFGYINMMMCN